MVAVGGESPAFDFGYDVGTAFYCVLVFFDDNSGCTTTGYKTVAVAVERARCFCRSVFAG